MKTHFLLIFLFLYSIANAQTPNWWPTHPMDTRIGNKPQVQPDTVINKSGYELGEDTDKWMTTYVHYYGDNGYIDTTKVLYCTDPDILPDYKSSILIYAKENNKLISEETYRFDNLSGLSSQTFYEYDSLDRRIEKRHIAYDNNHNITRNETQTYDLSTVIYTDSGYIFNGTTYCFDEKGRLIKEISGGGTSYTYTSTYTYYDDERRYDIYRDTDSWCFLGYHNTKCFFEENDLPSKSISFDPGRPDYKYVIEDFYFFSSEAPTNNSVITDLPNIYGVSGSLMVSTDQPEWISVYSLSGQLIQKTYIQIGNQQIPLAKGIYIVKSDSKTTKVIIK